MKLPDFSARWLLSAYLVGLQTTVNAAESDIFEVDLLFPRNDSYAPTPYAPIVFAIQNPGAGQYIVPDIRYEIWNASDNYISNGEPYYSMTYGGMRGLWSNLSASDPHFLPFMTPHLSKPGTWLLNFTVLYYHCDLEDVNNGSKKIGGPVRFTVEEGAQPIDLVNITANDETCSANMGVAINVTDEIRDVDFDYGGNKCAVVGSATVTPDPCKVKVDATVAESISASWTAEVCKYPADKRADSSVECPQKKSGGETLAVAGMAGLAAAVGALGFLLLV